MHAARQFLRGGLDWVGRIAAGSPAIRSLSFNPQEIQPAGTPAPSLVSRQPIRHLGFPLVPLKPLPVRPAPQVLEGITTAAMAHAELFPNAPFGRGEVGQARSPLLGVNVHTRGR